MYSLDVDFGFNDSNSIKYKNVNLEFQDGDIINIIGENGCGKSSFYKMLMGQIRTLRGKVPKSISDNIVVVSDYVKIPGECNVEDVVALLKESACDYLKENFSIIYEYVMNINKKEVSVLSSGQIRVLEIFCALSTQKKMLVLDEASNGLDIYNRQILIEQIQILAATNNIVIFSTTHHLEDILEIGGTILCMNKYKGEIVKYDGKYDLNDITAFLKESGK